MGGQRREKGNGKGWGPCMYRASERDADEISVKVENCTGLPEWSLNFKRKFTNCKSKQIAEMAPSSSSPPRSNLFYVFAGWGHEQRRNFDIYKHHTPTVSLKRSKQSIILKNLSQPKSKNGNQAKVPEIFFLNQFEIHIKIYLKCQKYRPETYL